MSFCYTYASPWYLRGFSLSRLRDAPFRRIWHAAESQDRSEVALVGKSVGRTLRGSLLSRRSLPFKPPPLCSHPPSLPPPFYPVLYILLLRVPESPASRPRATFLFPSFSFPCTLGKPALSPLFRSSPMGEFSPPSPSSSPHCALLDEARWRNVRDRIRREGWRNPMARGTFVISTQDSYLARVQRTLSGRLGNNSGGEGGKHARGDGRLIGLEMAGRSTRRTGVYSESVP